MPWGYDHMWGWGMGISMFIFWIVVIVGGIFLIKALAAGGKGQRTEETPLDVLKKRYARGEISKAEFEEKKKDIQ